MIKRSLASIRNVPGTNVRPQQSFGPTILSQIMTRDIGTKTVCGRKNCLVCQKPGSKGKCQDQSITYQIACDRPPCSNGYNMKTPLELPAPSSDPPALYRGESSKDCYLRGVQHHRDYKAKSDGSALWRHTVSHYGGVIGAENGINDYFMTKLDTLARPLDRIASEGVLIGELDNLEEEKRAISLNSKRDYMQANTVTLSFNRGAAKHWCLCACFHSYFNKYLVNLIITKPMNYVLGIYKPM